MLILEAFVRSLLATISLGLVLLANVAYAVVALNPRRRGGPDVHLGCGDVSKGVRWWEPISLLMMLDAAVIVFAWYGISPESLVDEIVEGWAWGWVCVGGILLPLLVLALVAAVLGWAWLQVRRDRSRASSGREVVRYR